MLRAAEIAFFNHITNRGLAIDYLGFKYHFNLSRVYADDAPYLEKGRRVLISADDDMEHEYMVEIPSNNFNRYCEEEMELWQSQTREIVNE